MKKRGQGKSRRIFAVFICLCVLFTTQPEIWKGFTVYAAEESDTKAVFSFADLTEEVKEQTVTVGTDYEKLELPEELTVFISQAEASSATDTAEEKKEDFEREQEIVTGITWQSEPEYDENTAGTYIFTAILPEGYALMDGVSLPQITVTVWENEEETEDTEVLALLDRIAALPDLEEYLAAEPDMDGDEDAYNEWLETLYAYAEEVLAICEEYEALTEDRKAQIPEAEMAKLTAWAEFAETLADSMAVMTAATTVASGTCGDSLTWTLDSDGTLTISGSGAMSSFSQTTMPWYSNITDIKTVTIENGVTSIGNYAFRGCSSLESITIPSGVTSIGTCAFYDCSSLTSIEIPESVTSIGTYAFRGCSLLESITIPSGVTSIGNYTFFGCSSLTSIEIPSGVTSIGTSAFHNCSSLALVIMEGESPATLGSLVFNNCKFVANSRKDLVVPAGTRSSYVSETTWSTWANYIHEDHDSITWTAWTDSTSLPTTAGNYYLATDVTLGAMWTVPSGETKLCLNGHTINKSADSTSTISVGSGRTLNLYDCQEDGTITANGSTRVLHVGYGTLNLYGGTVTNGITGVYVGSGTFNMYGGCIKGNTTSTGMGVSVSDSKFAMYGGSISGNNRGVMVDGYSTLELSGNVVIFGNLEHDVQLAISNASDERPPSEDDEFEEEADNASCYVTGELGEDAKIGIELYWFDGNTYPLTAVTGTNDYKITQSDYEKFTSGNASYPLNLNANNEIEFLASYTVTYDYATNGGTSATKDSAQVLVKDDVDLTPTATKEGYTFVGWNTDSDATTALTSLTMGSAAVTLYAIYKVNTYYEVTLHGNGGSGTALTSYTYGTGAVLPTDWERTGYSFDGWYDNESCTGTAVTAISTTDTENKEYWAKWAHIHSGTLVEAQEATCTEKGNSAYYICDCGKWFSDSGCTQEVTAQDVTIKALGHDYSGNYQFDETGHWKECSRCQEEQQKQNHVYDNDEDRFCNECGYEREPERQDEGTLEKDAVVAEDAPIEQAALDNEKAELLATVGIFTEEEKEEIAGGTNAKVWLEVTKTDESDISDADKAAAIKAAREVMGDNTKLVYFDVDLFKQVEGRQKTKISEPGVPIKVSIRIPEALLNGDNTILREYKIIRLHNGEVTVIDGAFDAETGAFSFETDKFSTYAIAYSDTQLVTGITLTPESATLTKKGETLQLTATVTPDNAADKSVTWSSDNPLVATVDANGQVTAVSNGTAVITVTSGDGGKTAISTIQVEIPDNTESPNVSNEPDKKTESPKTGDDSNPAFWMILLLLSMTVMAGLLAKKRKPVRTNKK